MIDAGIQASTAVKTINKVKHRDNQALARMASMLERGASLSSAFERTGLLSKFELAMVVSAEKAGRVAQGLAHISQERKQSIEQANTLASAFFLPKAILLIGAVAAIFIRIFQSKQDAFTAIIEVSLLFIVALFLIRLFLYLWSRDVGIYLSLAWPLEFIRRRSGWFQSQFEYKFYRSLNWQLQSGVAADQAVNRCSTMLTNLGYKKSLAHAVNDLKSGQSIPDSLANQNLALSSRMKQILVVANQTGTFERSIDAELKLLKARIDLRIEQQIKWLPKVLYVLVLWFVLTYLI